MKRLRSRPYSMGNPAGWAVAAVLLATGAAVSGAGAATGAAAGSTESAASGTATVRVLFHDKPPFSWLDQDKPRGLFYERTRKVFDIAGIRTRYEMLPPMRIFAEIEADLAPVCTFGWYEVPALAAIGRFSRPIHKDRPVVALARGQVAQRLREAGTLERVVADTRLTLAAVDGVSHGPELDALLARFGARVDRALVSTPQIVQKVAAGRVDFMLIDPDELAYLRTIDRDGQLATLHVVGFADAPAGARRHIVCSRRVSAAQMERIDAVILRLLP